MDTTLLELDDPIPGVRPAEQNRSRALQDRFVIAGRKVLLTTRLDDLAIPVLAKAAESSVGGFYSRFETKDAFFEFLRRRMLIEHMVLYEDHLSPSRFEGKARQDVSEAFVDVMLIVFSGPWRGVLREAYALLTLRPESWAPMKARGQYLRQRVAELYSPLVGNRAGLEERVSFAMQLLFSALNNEMMNPNLSFSIKDEAFRRHLIVTLDTLVAGDLTLPMTDGEGKHDA